MSPQLQEISVDELRPAEWNRDIGDVSDLVESIRMHGVLQPLLVRQNGAGFELIAGERRWTAAKLAGLATVPCVLRETDNLSNLEEQLVENLLRKDLEPLEEAEGYRRLVELGVAQKDIAARVGRSQAHVSKRLEVLELPDIARKALSAGNLTLEDAYELRALKDMPKLTAEALKLGAQWRNMPRAIEQVIRARDNERKRAEVEKKLRDAGVRIVKRVYDRSQMQLGTGYGCLGVTPAKHKGEPCHAAAIGEEWDGFKPTYLCTDPSRHAKKGPSEIKLPIADASGKSRASLREDAERKELNAARKARVGVLRELVAGRALTSRKQLDILAQTLVCERDLHDWAAIACEILGLDPKANGRNDPRGTLRTYADESQANLLRAGVAMAFAAHENSLRWTYHTWDADDRDYLELLEFHGYEISKIEEKKLAKVSK